LSSKNILTKFKETKWEMIRFYTSFTWRFLVLQRLEPLFYGIVVTDRCNLKCLGCKVSNTGRPDMTWSQLIDSMRNAWKRGFRELYFSGGEPMLWCDGAHTLEDAVVEAKKIGFFYVRHPTIMDTEEAKSERFIAHLKQENAELKSELVRLSNLKTARKTNSKRKF